MLSLKGKKVLVTGADGFIGSHLIERLINDGANVKALVYYNSWESLGLLNGLKDINKKCEIVKGDIRDPHFCLKITQGQEYIFHLAALIAIPYSYIAPTSFFETNVLGTVNLLEGVRENSKLKRFIAISTSETYGTALYSPMDEKHELQAQSPYAASKVGSDKASMSYHLSFQMPVTIVRPFNNYGPRQSSRAVIPTIITQLLTPKIKKVKLGSLDPIRDYTYALDTVDAFVKSALSSRTIGEVVNVGTGKGYSIGEIYKIASEIIGVKKEVELDKKRIRPVKSEVWKLVCDSKKIKKLAGWKPETNFKEGLKTTIDWISDNLDHYSPETYSI